MTDDFETDEELMDDNVYMNTDNFETLEDYIEYSRYIVLLKIVKAIQKNEDDYSQEELILGLGDVLAAIVRRHLPKKIKQNVPTKQDKQDNKMTIISFNEIYLESITKKADMIMYKNQHRNEVDWSDEDKCDLRDCRVEMARLIKLINEDD